MSLAADLPAYPAAPGAAGAAPPLSSGSLLGGRVAYAQSRDGYRTGIEPVLLAASVPARPGQRVVEAGTGAGAGLLCLAARVTGVQGLGLEIDPSLVRLALANFAGNGRAELAAVPQDVAAWRPDALYDHAFANPPWHRAGATPSPVPGRLLAKQATTGLLEGWARALGAGLRRGGTLSLILPAANLGEGVAALRAAGCPQVSVLPLWPRAGTAARRLILRGVRLGAGDCAVLPGLVLHGPGGGYTPEAEAILRGAGPLGPPCA